MPFNKACADCNGSRAEKGSSSKTCRACNGQGIVEKQHRQGMFIQISQEACGKCKGSGEIPDKVCKFLFLVQGDAFALIFGNGMISIPSAEYASGRIYVGDPAFGRISSTRQFHCITFVKL